MKCKSLINRYGLAVFLAAAAAALFALARLFPLSGDDWQWGSERFALITVNGRYLGNLFAMMLSRVPQLRPFVFSLTLTAIIYFTAAIPRQTPGEATAGFAAVSALMLMLIPVAMLRQVYVWTSGFCNYTIPVALLLCVVHFRLRRPDAGALYIALTCLPAFAGMLFAEHITVFAAAAAVLYSIYLLLQTPRRLDAFAAALAFAFTTGAVLMFSNSAYTTHGADGAHRMPSRGEFSTNISENFYNTIAPFAITANLPLILLLAALTISAIRASERARFGRGKISLALTAYIVLYNFYVLLRRYCATALSGALFIKLDGVLAALFYLAVLASAALYLERGKLRNLTLLTLLSAAAVCLPLTIVKPVGERCIFAAYVFLVLAALTLLEYLRGKNTLRRGGFASVIAKAAAPSALACVFLMYFLIYGRIAAAGRERMTYIARQIESGAKELAVPQLPLEDYIWVGTPDDDYNQAMFKRYYKIGNDVSIQFISPDIR